MKILHIKVSPNGSESSSRQISEYLVSQLRKTYPEINERILDLSRIKLPHLDRETIQSFFMNENERSEKQKALIALSDKLVNDLFDCDICLISSPIWNFSLQSSLKAWIDHITRVGRTFGFKEDGQKEGYLKGKKAIIIASSGGLFSSGPYAELDSFKRPLEIMLSFIGIDDTQFIRVEGTNDPRYMKSSLKKTREKVDQVLTQNKF